MDQVGGSADMSQDWLISATLTPVAAVSWQACWEEGCWLVQDDFNPQGCLLVGVIGETDFNVFHHSAGYPVLVHMSVASSKRVRGITLGFLRP